MFANRIAVVTGGGSGIGRAVAQRLAKERASVVIADQNLNGAKETKQLIDGNASDAKHIAVECDVSRMDSVKNLFHTLVENYSNKAATLLVNSAGITRDKFIVDMSEQDFDKVIAVNLKGTFLATQLFCQMIKQQQPGEGSIVNITSVSAELGNMGQVNYNASKSAVEALTRTTAREMAKYNVRCNAVMPGFINTPIVSTVPPKVMEQLLANIPLRRQGQPEEVADAIAFLLSAQSSYVTGVVLQVSGGLAM